MTALGEPSQGKAYHMHHDHLLHRTAGSTPHVLAVASLAVASLAVASLAVASLAVASLAVTSLAVLRIVTVAAVTVAAVMSASGQSVMAQGTPPATRGVQSAPAAALKCPVVPDLARIELPLTRLAFRLASGLPIKIVAIGSSSTAGAGASSPSGSYPSQLGVELGHHFPGHKFTVVNSGVNGEEAADMVARFDQAVIAENPHLVLWQVGTNSLLRDRPLDARATVLHDGLARLKTVRTDVVLVDPQYAPRVIAKRDAAEATVAALATVAKQEKVSVFRRFAIMRRWQEDDGLPFDAFVSPDGLHMNDWGYACVAKWLGVAIMEAATRPTATASAPRPTK